MAPPSAEEGPGAASDEPIVTPGESVGVNDVGWTILKAVLTDLSLLGGHGGFDSPTSGVENTS